MKYKDMIMIQNQKCITFSHQQCLLYPPPPSQEAELHFWWPAQVYDKNSHDLQILKHTTAWEELIVFVDYFKIMA